MAGSDTPRYSVVVPAYQAAGTLDACLAALARQTVPPGSYEVIVVDDGSTDGTASIAEAAGVTLLRQDHAGAAAARNCGAVAARGDLLLFTDCGLRPRAELDRRPHGALLRSGSRRRKGDVPHAQRKQSRAFHPDRVRGPLRPDARRGAHRLHRHLQRGLSPRHLPRERRLRSALPDESRTRSSRSGWRRRATGWSLRPTHRSITSTTARSASTSGASSKSACGRCASRGSIPTQVVQGLAHARSAQGPAGDCGDQPGAHRAMLGVTVSPPAAPGGRAGSPGSAFAHRYST